MDGHKPLWKRHTTATSGSVIASVAALIGSGHVDGDQFILLGTGAVVLLTYAIESWRDVVLAKGGTLPPIVDDVVDVIEDYEGDLVQSLVATPQPVPQPDAGEEGSLGESEK